MTLKEVQGVGRCRICRQPSYQAVLRRDQEERAARAKLNIGFALRDSLCRPTFDFPGVDIDAIHYRPKSKKIKEAA